MKTRNLFLSLFAFAALCACNKEVQPETPQVLGEDAYVAVNICAAGTDTKAVDYQLGTEAENAVKNALFLFYDAAGNPAAFVTPALEAWTPGTDGQNVASTQTVLVLDNTVVRPTSMLVVLNYDDTKLADYKTASLSDIKEMVASLSVNISSTDYYTMSNSVYANGQNIFCEVALTGDNFQNSVENAKSHPVTAYIERVAAKINVDASAPTIYSSEISIDGVSKTLTPTVLGYKIIETPDASNLFKNVDPVTWNDNWTGWTLPGDYRSFWAKMPAPEDYNLTYYSHKEMNNTGEFYDYYHENTSGGATTTKLIVAAQLKDGVNEVDFVKFAGLYYTLETFKDMSIIALGSTELPVTLDMLDVVAQNNLNQPKRYQMHLKLNAAYTGSDKDAKNTLLEGRTALYWQKGKSYYFVDIQDVTAPDGFKSGVVRNHYYDITVNSIKGLGVPVPDDNADIDPETLTEEHYNVAATINILQWRIVEQSVDFNN